jgi:ferredoxin, 2Fe-2S
MTAPTAIVTVQPSGIQVGAQFDEPVMAAAVRAGYAWPTICGGHGECHACFTMVVTGAENLSPMLPYEAEGVAQVAGNGRQSGDPVRLACQARVRGDVTVFKRGVRPAHAAD